MTEVHLREFRQLLMMRRDQLRARGDQARELREVPELDRYGYDPVDRAVQEDDKNRVAMQGQAQLQELLAVDAALTRIEDGSYGECAICGKSIGVGRLRAIPQATMCAECATQQELTRGPSLRPLV